MTAPQRLSHFFGRMAVPKNYRTRVAGDPLPSDEIVARAETVLKIAKPVAENREIVTLNPQGTWLQHHVARETWALSYAGSIAGQWVEVVDIEPRKVDFTDTLYTIARMVSISPADLRVARKLHLWLTPDHVPVITLYNGYEMDERFVNSGRTALKAVTAVQKVINAINPALPDPEWVTNFDRRFQYTQNGLVQQIPSYEPA